MPLVYQHLRQIAQQSLSEQDAKRWDATELVHEAYIRLIGNEPVAPVNRTHFFALAATAIRRILVDSARKAKSQKRGGQFDQSMIEIQNVGLKDSVDLASLDDALRHLEELSPRQAKLVELRFFGGLSEEEAANYLGVSRRTAAGDWAMARAWLFRELSE